jgi:hypothetical protein
MRPKQVWLMSHERVVDANRLNELEAKERAHDGYLAATKRMSVAAFEQRKLRRSGERDQRLYSMGWLDSLYAFNEAVVAETGSILNEEIEEDPIQEMERQAEQHFEASIAGTQDV